MMKRDRKETTKYLFDLNEQTPFKCLTINYIDQVRAVLNYGFLGLDCFKNSNNLNIPNDNTGSSDIESDTDSNTGSDTGTGSGTDTGTGGHGNDTPTICEASSFTPMPPDKTLLTADTPDDGNSYGILITAMIRTKEQEALLHHVIDAKTGAEEFIDTRYGSWLLIIKMLISSLNLPNLGESGDIHTNPTLFNKDWFTRLYVEFHEGFDEINNTYAVGVNVSGIDTGNAHLWGTTVHYEYKESHDLHEGHSFLQDPDTITITRATQEEQDAYLRIGDEYSTIPNSIYQATNIVKRVDLIDVVNSGNDIIIKSCLKAVPFKSAFKPEPEPYDKNLHFRIIENTSGKIFHERWDSHIELNRQEKLHLILFDLRVGEELLIQFAMTYDTEFSLIPEEMSSDDIDNWKLRGLGKEILSVKFEQEDIFRIKANTPMENGTDSDITHLSLTQYPYMQHSDRLDFIKILRVSPTHFLVKIDKTPERDFIFNESNHLNSTDFENGIYIFSNETIRSFTLKLNGYFNWLGINKKNYFNEVLKYKLNFDTWSRQPFIKWTSQPNDVSKYNFIKGYPNSGQTGTFIHKCELHVGMHFLIDTSYYKGSGATLTFGIEPADYPTKKIGDFKSVNADALENPFIELSLIGQPNFVVDGQVVHLSALKYDKLYIRTSVHHLLPIWVWIEDTGEVFEYPND